MVSSGDSGRGLAVQNSDRVMMKSEQSSFIGVCLVV